MVEPAITAPELAAWWEDNMRCYPHPGDAVASKLIERLELARRHHVALLQLPSEETPRRQKAAQKLRADAVAKFLAVLDERASFLVTLLPTCPRS